MRRSNKELKEKLLLKEGKELQFIQRINEI
jgi:hypothetical protein